MVPFVINIPPGKRTLLSSDMRVFLSWIDLVLLHISNRRWEFLFLELIHFDFIPPTRSECLENDSLLSNNESFFKQQIYIYIYLSSDLVVSTYLADPVITLTPAMADN